MHNPTVLATLTAVLAALPAAQGLYYKHSPVLQLDSTNYDKLINKSNYTSIVEFYAPWCGHCQNLQPHYEQVARKLYGIAKVAAIDCNEESNKQFCAMQGVKGFPTLKIVRPGKKFGRPVVEDYQGERTAAAISSALASKINNHVTRVTSAELDGFLGGDKPKAIFFSSKGTTSPLLRSIAIDFLDVISVGQIRDKETAAVKQFGITNFPSLVLIPSKDAEPILYDGAIEKKAIVEFLSQAGQPNPDATSNVTKKDTKKDTKSKTDDKKSKTSKAKKNEKAKAAKEEETVKLEEPSSATSETTEQSAIPTIVPISALSTQEELTKECLERKSSTCLLVFHPSEESETGEKAISTLSHLNTKYVHGGRHLFPFYSIASDSEAASVLPKALELEGEVNLIAINARRGWWRRYGGDYSLHRVESWLDGIRMGEGEKKKLPQGVVVEVGEKSEETSTESVETTKSTEAAEEPVVEAETVEEPAEQPVEEPAEEATEQVVEEPIEEPVEEKEEEIIHEEL